MHEYLRVNKIRVRANKHLTSHYDDDDDDDSLVVDVYKYERKQIHAMRFAYKFM